MTEPDSIIVLDHERWSAKQVPVRNIREILKSVRDSSAWEESSGPSAQGYERLEIEIDKLRKRVEALERKVSDEQG